MHEMRLLLDRRVIKLSILGAIGFLCFSVNPNEISAQDATEHGN
jgi:hypothetical protein